jgi:hypothetical protein
MSRQVYDSKQVEFFLNDKGINKGSSTSEVGRSSERNPSFPITGEGEGV